MTNVLAVTWKDNDYWLYVNGTPRKAKDIAKEWERLYGGRDQGEGDPLVICALALSAVAWTVAVIFALGSLILYWRD